MKTKETTVARLTARIDLINRCIARVRAGERLNAVAAAEGVWTSQVSHWAHEYGIGKATRGAPKGRRPVTALKIQRAKQLRAEGFSINQIAAEMGITKQYANILRK